MTLSNSLAGTLVSARSGSLRRVAGRLGWGVADQAISSLGNFALGLYLARVLGATGFGAFTLVFVTSSVALNASRGLATDPLLVRHSGPADEPWRRATGAATGTAVGVGLTCGLLSAGAGLLLPAPVGPAFLALAAVLPGLMLLDSWRFAYFSCGRGRAAFAVDLGWTVLLLITLAPLHIVGGVTAARAVLAWGVTATLAGLLAAVRGGVRPRLGAVPSWLRRHRDLAGRYFAENVTFSGASQIRAVLLSSAATLAAVGQLRAAEMLMGPFVVVLMGLSQVAVPESARMLRGGADRLLRFCLALGSVQAVAALAWGAMMLVLMPLGVGRLLLGELWPAATRLLPAVTLVVVASCYTTAAGAGLRALGAAHRSLRAQLIASALYIAGGGGGAVAGGAVGAAWGSAAATLLAALLWWQQLHAGLREAAELTHGEPVPFATKTSSASGGQ
jgi:O-antigen/teichoic acid export membrane protein